MSSCLPGSHLGCSTTLRFAIFGEDPLADLSVPPVFQWVSEVWQQEIDEGWFRDAWKNVISSKAQKLQQSRVGPASAVMLSLEGVGWAWPAWHTFISRQGFQNDLRQTCPYDVRSMFRFDVDLAIWEKWCVDDGAELDLDLTLSH